MVRIQILCKSLYFYFFIGEVLFDTAKTNKAVKAVDRFFAGDFQLSDESTGTYAIIPLGNDLVLRTSYEFLQDAFVLRVQTSQDLTGPLFNKEIGEWRNIYAQIEKFDFCKSRHKVTFIDRDEEDWLEDGEMSLEEAIAYREQRNREFEAWWARFNSEEGLAEWSKLYENY